MEEEPLRYEENSIILVSSPIFFGWTPLNESVCKGDGCRGFPTTVGYIPVERVFLVSECLGDPFDRTLEGEITPVKP